MHDFNHTSVRGRCATDSLWNRSNQPSSNLFMKTLDGVMKKGSTKAVNMHMDVWDNLVRLFLAPVNVGVNIIHIS